MIKATVLEEGGGTAVITQKRGRGRPRKEESLRIAAEKSEEKPKRKPRFELPEMPHIEPGERKKISVTFPLDEKCLAKTEFENIWFLYPRLIDYPSRKLGDSNNPRGHSPDCLKNSVMRDAEVTLREFPEKFHLINRGLTILAESFEYKNGQATITISNSNHGVADGASSETLLAKAQALVAKAQEKNAALPENEREEIPDFLERGRLRIELITGIKDHSLIAQIVQARNTSRQVKGFSMANFTGSFDFLKEELEKEGSPFKGKIAYEEGADGFSVLNVLSILTLFHPEFDTLSDEGKVKAPVIAYANKGSLPKRLENEELLKGYKSLSPILIEILSLYEYIYANFEKAYSVAFHNKVKLGRRKGFDSRLLDEEKITLPLTGLVSNYRIENGILYPLVAAFRSLVRISRQGEASFKRSAPKFFDEHGPRLVSHLIEELDQEATPNALGKSVRSYIALHREAKLILTDEKGE